MLPEGFWGQTGEQRVVQGILIRSCPGYLVDERIIMPARICEG
ncbi:hypothetical protein [Methanospirillum sp.]|nr:hypothetical protein [Methanospirillum sp.]